MAQSSYRSLDPTKRDKLLLEWESDEPELESDRHRDQIDLLLNCIRSGWRDRNDFYATGNLTIYYSPTQDTRRDFRGPDFFVVLGVDPRPRRSWMVWREDYRYPNVIIEFLSDSTAREDRTTKKDLYQNTFQTPEYFWFDPWTAEEFVGFRLQGGIYQPIQPNTQGWLWSDQLGLYLGVYQGQLRFFTATGELVPTEAEAERRRAEQAERQAQQAERQAQQAEQQAKEEIAINLLNLGLDPQQISATTGLTPDQIQRLQGDP